MQPQAYFSFFYFYVFLLFFFKLFIYLWLHWVPAAVHGPSPAAASRGYSSSRCMGLSLWWPLPLRSTGSRRAGSVVVACGFSSCGSRAQQLWLAGSAVVAHGLSCSTARGIFPDQGSNPCPLHWQADSQPLCHQGSPSILFFFAERESIYLLSIYPSIIYLSI